MESIILDGNKMKTIDSTHSYIKKTLKIQDYYGKNLDALWDMLTSIGHPVFIQLKHFDTVYSNLGDYANKLCQVFMDASVENEFLDIEISR